MNWHVYIILCTDNSLYTGIATDVDKRWYRHISRRGAKYFRGHIPLRIVYRESGHSRSSASRREAAIKKMRRVDKVRLIASDSNEVDQRERNP